MGTRRETVRLLTATIKPDLEDSPNMRFCFRVVSPEREYRLQAENQADRARWMEAISTAIAGLLSNSHVIAERVAEYPKSRARRRRNRRAPASEAKCPSPRRASRPSRARPRAGSSAATSPDRPRCRPTPRVEEAAAARDRGWGIPSRWTLASPWPRSAALPVTRSAPTAGWRTRTGRP